jgi:hypothetical protein
MLMIGANQPGRQEARIRDDEEGARDALAEIELARIDLERVRRDDVLEVEDACLVDLFGQYREDLRCVLLLSERQKVGEGHIIVVRGPASASLLRPD